MKKQAQGLSINTLVIAALALFVLIILIFVFRAQVQKSTRQYGEITKTAEEDIKAKNKCQTLFSGRECFSSRPEGYVCLPGEWNDCNELQKQYCCERG